MNTYKEELIKKFKGFHSQLRFKEELLYQNSNF